jgi:dynactin-4
LQTRCTRSCFQCPICIGPLGVTSLETPPDPGLLAADNASAPSGPYILACSYCNWSSTEIGIKFDKPNGIYAQLQKLRNGGHPRLTAKERKERRKEASQTTASTQAETAKDETLDVETQFESLKAFYQNQLAEASSAASGLSALGDLGVSSPSSLARIMSLYSGDNLHSKKSAARAGPMREALDSDEGLQIANLDESSATEAFRRAGWEDTNSSEQLAAQGGNPPGEPLLYGRTRLASELRPIPVLLRTKRSKRCPVCRHIISKPEAKVLSTRFRIRLVAGSYIPSISIRPLSAPPPAGAGAAAATAAGELQPLKPVQYLLTFKNPIFESVKVTLATPAATPGRFASKVTVLCPQFEIDANTDVWDEALKDGDGDANLRRGRAGEAAGGAGSHRHNHGYQAEAGKIWERGRNWVSIVVEVIPASLRLSSVVEGADTSPPGQDEDILEIPMFVRIEWEVDAVGDEVGVPPGTAKDREAKEKRELAYWSVLGIGRISQG